jgi:hypothetical protein
VEIDTADTVEILDAHAALDTALVPREIAGSPATLSQRIDYLYAQLRVAQVLDRLSEPLMFYSYSRKGHE